MSKLEQEIAELESSFDEEKLPAGFAEKYTLIECLAKSHGTETFLICLKENGKYGVAKCYDRAVYSEVCETSIIKGLNNPGLPEYMDSFEDESRSVTVRSYVEGTPLDIFAEKNRISEEQAKDICIKLCEILSYLHSQKPPVIHRDIKPQNIIVKEDGGISLIDFDIARRYSEGAETDTQFFGTKVYAPPEQYGFSQTDCRADIYSLGVLLRFLLTGSEKEEPEKPLPESLKPIVGRCTAFSPKERYPSAEAVKKALINSGKKGGKKAVYAAGLLITAAIFTCFGFMLGRYTGAFQEKAEGLVFAEPLIEEAARVQLGKGKNEPITKEELLSVKSLYIFGTEVSDNIETFSKGLTEQGRYTRGGITSLADLAMMPYVTDIQISYQSIEDISGIEKLQYLRAVNLTHNPIKDITLLSGLNNLEEIRLYDTEISSALSLSGCPRAKIAELGKTFITSVKEVGGSQSLEYLSLQDSDANSIEGIGEFKNLISVNFCNTKIASYDELAELPKLSEIRVEMDEAESLEGLFEGSEVNIIIE